MQNTNLKKNKHMDLGDRIEIQQCLNKGMTFKGIAQIVGKDPTTISKEVKKHLVVQPVAAKRANLDGEPLQEKQCPLLLKAPFACNPCSKRHRRCAYQKQFYFAKQAHEAYESLLQEARTGIPLNKEKFYEIDAIISNGIKKGQRLYHIMQSNDLGVSKSTVYRHLQRGYLSANKLDFPRVVKFKPRRQSRGDFVPKAAKTGRTYNDFLAFIEENGISSWVEMDTVIGAPGGKVIMTFDFTFCNFMHGLLLDDKTSAEAAMRVKALKKRLNAGGVDFGSVFSLLLTDNGGEFADTHAFTCSLDGTVETALFFCDPYQSSQKPHVEKNHTLFRDIVPKGESFDSFTQETVDLIFSHVNSVKRKSLNGKTPFELFSFTFSPFIASLLGVVEIPACDVVQSPKLLKIPH